MNACSPPIVAHELVARPQVQVVRVGEDHRRAEHACRSSGSSAFTVASVPTGMNAGVSTAPCGVRERAGARGAGRSSRA